MPSTPFNINNPNSVWACNPTSQTVPLSTGAKFSNNSTSGCTICFKNSNLFGVGSLSLAAGTSETLSPAQGTLAGASTTFNVNNSGYNCTGDITGDTYPYDVTIGSG